MSSFNFFDKVYCVHDTHLAERDAKITAALKDFEVEWVFADRPYKGYTSSNYQASEGEFGNTLSHLKVFITALDYYNKHNIKNILVFEDDIEVRKAVDAENILGEALQNLPEEWALLYLGGSPQSPVIPVTPPLYKVERFICCFAYAVNTKYLANLAKFYVDELGKQWPQSVGDNIINNYFVYNKLPIYCIYPFVISHLTGYSDIRKGQRNYGDAYFDKIWKDKIRS